MTIIEVKESRLIILFYVLLFLIISLLFVNQNRLFYKNLSETYESAYNESSILAYENKVVAEDYIVKYSECNYNSLIMEINYKDLVIEKQELDLRYKLQERDLYYSKQDLNNLAWEYGKLEETLNNLSIYRVVK